MRGILFDRAGGNLSSITSCHLDPTKKDRKSHKVQKRYLGRRCEARTKGWSYLQGNIDAADSAKHYLQAERFFGKRVIAPTSRSRFPMCMYFSMKSRMVSHSAVKVGRVRRVFRYWRKTFERRVAPRIRVSSIPSGSAGLMFSNSLVRRGNRTRKKTRWRVDDLNGRTKEVFFSTKTSEVESRTQGSRPRPRTQKKSEAKAKDNLSEDRHSRGQGQECSRPRPRNKDTSASALQKKGLPKIFSGDL